MMQCLSTWGMLLAQSGVIERMGDRFRPGGNPWSPGQIAFVLLLLVTSVFVTWWLTLRWRDDGRQLIYDAKKLFDELVRAHHLSREERKALWRIARQQGDVEPAAVFVLPDRLHRAIAAETVEVRRQRLEQIAQRLFDELPGETSDDDDSDATGFSASPSEAVPAVPETPPG